jgi:glycosyltransferase involved in cell wall biosynthesis
LRLLATVEKYAPAIGGAERVVQRVAEGLAARGHEVHVLTGGAPEEIELAGVHVHRREMAGNEARGIQGDPSSVTGLIEDIQPDVVFNYAAQTWATDCCFELLGRDERPCMVLAPCGFSGLGSRRYREYFEAMPMRLRSYDALILHSTVYQDWHFCTDAGVEQIYVVPNGADPPADEGTPGLARSGHALAVTVGSHVLSKGHSDFSRAIRTLGRTRALTGAIVAPPRHGLDALRGCQVACWTRARTQQLHVVDGSTPGAVASAIAAADLFLFTSTVECAPLVILEAMAAGTPWVSYNVGNVSELRGGLVAGDRAELLRSAGEILDGEHARLAGDGRKAWEVEHRWPQIVARYESVFEQVLTASSTTSASRVAP